MSIDLESGRNILDSVHWRIAGGGALSESEAQNHFRLINADKTQATLCSTSNIINASMTLTFQMFVTATEGRWAGLSRSWWADPRYVRKAGRFSNISTRGFVGTAAKVMIPGFIVRQLATNTSPLVFVDLVRYDNSCTE